MGFGRKAGVFGATALLGVPVWAAMAASGQSEVHGRKYQPPPATGHIVILVEKAYNDKPLENAAVIFHATRNGKDNGNLEIKTNSQGKATMDFLETGSHVTVQVISHGYATAAQDFDVTEADQNILIKMQRPREQVSTYADNDGKASTLQPGLQEQQHRVTSSAAKPTTATLSGTLKDEHGGRVPGGIVRLHMVSESESAAADRSVASDATGNFKMERVAPGSYDLQVNAQGYADRTRHNVVLSAGENQIYQEILHSVPAADAAPRNPLPPAAGGPR